ncbi:hypothetical protein EI94DRAFT_1716916, partial [Lactarius quietus]
PEPKNPNYLSGLHIIRSRPPHHLVLNTLHPRSTNLHHRPRSSQHLSTSPNTILPTPHPSPAEQPQKHVQADIWRVVGIAVIAVSVVGTTILAVVFFDQWWNFLGDVCGRRKKRRKSGKEELVPDWERRSWEFRIEDNLPAYPSFGSPPVRQTVEEAVHHRGLICVNQAPCQIAHISLLRYSERTARGPSREVRRIDHPEAV